MNFGFWNGIGGWNPSPKPEHDHVRVMVRLDGSAFVGEPGLWPIETGGFNDAYWAETLNRIDAVIKLGKGVWLSFVPWHGDNTPTGAPTVHGLFGTPSNASRNADAYAKILLRACSDLAKYSPEQLVFEPLTETGFYPALPVDRADANNRFEMVCDTLVPAIRSVLHDHVLALGTYGFDQATGPSGIYPAFEPPYPFDSRYVYPLHFYSPVQLTQFAGLPYRWGDSAATLKNKAISLGVKTGRNEVGIMDSMNDGFDWNQSGIYSQIAVYTTWCRRWGTTPYIGEWGACEPHVSVAQKAAYEKDVLAAMVKLNVRRCKFEK